MLWAVPIASLSVGPGKPAEPTEPLPTYQAILRAADERGARFQSISVAWTTELTQPKGAVTRSGVEEAVEVLKHWAAGAALTEDAKLALGRLASRR